VSHYFRRVVARDSGDLATARQRLKAGLAPKSFEFKHFMPLAQSARALNAIKKIAPSEPEGKKKPADVAIGRADF
jgi:hypothetical protein